MFLPRMRGMRTLVKEVHGSQVPHVLSTAHTHFHICFLWKKQKWLCSLQRTQSALTLTTKSRLINFWFCLWYNYRITEWLRLGGTLRINLFQPPLEGTHSSRTGCSVRIFQFYFRSFPKTNWNSTSGWEINRTNNSWILRWEQASTSSWNTVLQTCSFFSWALIPYSEL